MLRKILGWLRLLDDPARAGQLSPEDKAKLARLDLAKLVRLDQMHPDVGRRAEAWDRQRRNGPRS
jgi:hypothetical protein